MTNGSPDQSREDRPFQFSLRTLLIVFTIAGLALGGYARSWKRHRDQRAAAELLKSKFDTPGYAVRPYGGISQLSVACTDKSSLTDDNLLDLLLFEKTGRKVACVQLIGSRITDEGLRNIVHLRSLKELMFKDMPIGDRGLAYVAQLPELRILRIEGPNAVTDEGLETLTKTPFLKTLGLVRMEITDDGLKHVANMTELEALSLTKVKITDAGLDHLRNLKRLKRLKIYYTGCSEGALRKLAQDLPDCEFDSDLIYEEL